MTRLKRCETNVLTDRQGETLVANRISPALFAAMHEKPGTQHFILTRSDRDYHLDPVSLVFSARESPKRAYSQRAANVVTGGYPDECTGTGSLSQKSRYAVSSSRDRAVAL